ncbi:MAG: DNA internalization-related competence protein ComEC/Rec2 [Nitrospirae bacterium]|nr:DNA internalization-related competence protein ComEC/Rec2 [Nitrospirota bacterium]
MTFALPFISGIAVYNFLPYFPFSISIIISVIVAAGLIKNRQGNKIAKRSSSQIALMAFALIAGFLYSNIRHEDFPAVKLPEGESIIKGTVADMPVLSGGKLRFTIDDVNINGEDLPGKVRLSAPAPLEISSLTGQAETGHGYNDRIKAIARLKEPAVFLNPGVYSYDLRRDGVFAAGFSKQIEVIEEGSGFFHRVYKKRQGLGKMFNESLTEENASFLKAIVLGLQTEINQNLRNAFSATGLAHLLSVSGTHFGLLAFILFKIIKGLVKVMPYRLFARLTLYITPTQIAVIITLPLLILYAIISGGSIPTIRSFIMVFIYMAALFLGRKGQWLNSLSIAAVIILLWEPRALFDLSFQLSFLAVLSIGYVLEKYKPDEEWEKGPKVGATRPSLLKRAFEGIKTSIMITVAATLGTAPLVAYYFYQFPLISPLANLIVTPLVCFVLLPVGFFSGFIAIIFNSSFLPMGWLIDKISDVSLNLIKLLSTVPYANLHIPKPSIIIICLYFLSMGIFLKSKSKWRLSPFVIVVALYILNPSFNNHSLRVTFFDVGQGDASLIELPDRKTMLIDGGSKDLKTGRKVIAPYLWSRGIKKIDFVVLSHPHPDHYGGLIYIMDNFRVGEIWGNGRVIPGSEEFFEKAVEKQIPYRVIERGDSVEGKGYRIYCFHPYREFHAGSQRGDFSNQNSDSLVLKIEAKGLSVLFTGDIEVEAEENLIHLHKWLKSDIIKVPHHGGRTSSSDAFLYSVKPRFAVISAGRNNPFNHPHIEALERYSRSVRVGTTVATTLDSETELFRTDRDGAVTVTLRDTKYEIKTYHDSRLKKVVGRYDSQRLVLRIPSWRDEIRNLRLLI